MFSNLIDELVKRDELFRKELIDTVRKSGGHGPLAPTSIQIPTTPGLSETSVASPGVHSYPMTPGMGIGIATPGPLNHLPGVPEDGATTNKRESQASLPGADKSGDYFSSAAPPSEASSKPATENPVEEKPPDADKDTNGKDNNSLFSKKFRMGSMSFGSKKLGRSASTATSEKPAVIDGKALDGSEPPENNGEEKEKEFDDNFLGVVQRIQNEYKRALQENPEYQPQSGIIPSLPNETPVLKLPPATTVIIQEETSGGSADLYRGTVATVGEDATLITERAPFWLGDLLLRVGDQLDSLQDILSDIQQNRIPLKEPVKVSFILQPWQDLLPSIASSDGNSRLNANRMLRVKKILGYIAERVEAPPEEPDPNALRPEEYLELYCYDQVSYSSAFGDLSNTVQKLPVTMSLATLRAHIWKGGADVMLFYKSNGRKSIANEKRPAASSSSEAGTDLGSGTASASIT